MLPLLALFLLRCAVSASALEMPDGAWVLSAAAGIGQGSGAAKTAGGGASHLGGQILTHPKGEYAVGLAVDRLDFAGKPAGKFDASIVSALGRVYLPLDYESTMVYLLSSLGWSEARADIAAGGGTDRGSGPAFSLGAGLEYYLGSRLNAGAELRLHRAGAGVPRLGLPGVTALTLSVKLGFTLGPDPDPFGR